MSDIQIQQWKVQSKRKEDTTGNICLMLSILFQELLTGEGEKQSGRVASGLHEVVQSKLCGVYH